MLPRWVLNIMKNKKVNIYSDVNNYVFDYLTNFSRKNLYSIIHNGKILLENEGFDFCRKLKEKNRLENFTVKDLNLIIEKIYQYIIQNKETLIQKYGNRGKYKECVKACKTLKQKQKISAIRSAQINSQKKQDLTIKTIQKLLAGNGKITIKEICNISKLDNKTVIKYYKDLINDIKNHNLAIKNTNYSATVGE